MVSYGFLHLKDFPQMLHGMTIPSKCLTSMWSFIWLLSPSFPQTLQRSALRFPLLTFETMLSLFSIVDRTLSSRTSRFSEKDLETATFLSQLSSDNLLLYVWRSYNFSEPFEPLPRSGMFLGRTYFFDSNTDTYVLSRETVALQWVCTESLTCGKIHFGN